MTVGGSIFLIVVGAILRFAVNESVSGIDLQTVGLILMVAGVVGLVIGLWMFSRARAVAVPVERRPVEPRDRY